MRKILTMAAAVISALAVLPSCSKKAAQLEQPAAIIGDWNIVSIEVKSAAVGSREVDVYLSFDESGAFTVYQKTGGIRYERFTGTWTLKSDVLSGIYADGSRLACDYAVSVSDGTLTLTSMSEPAEISVYKRASIPDSVIREAVD